MSIGALDSAMRTPGDLAQTLLGGQMQEVDQSMQVAKVAMQMQLKDQEMQQTQAAVAAMTGVGGNLNAVV